jgi:cell division protein FtsB
MKYGNRSLWKRLFYSPAAIGIAIIALVFMVRGAIGVHDKALLAQDRYDQAQTELESLQDQKESLSTSIDRLSTPAGVEAELREKYHGVKEGESVAVIVDPSSSPKDLAGTSTAVVASSTSELSWWGYILRFIGL